MTCRHIGAFGAPGTCIDCTDSILDAKAVSTARLRAIDGSTLWSPAPLSMRPRLRHQM
jgi:hypothetical protein